MFGKKIKLSDPAYEKAKVAAEIAGASSLEEFIERIVVKESDRLISSTGKNREVSKEEADAIAKQMAGLGYLE